MRLRPALLLPLLLAGCSGASRATPDLPPLRTVEHVDLDRYLDLDLGLILFFIFRPIKI
jgi:hypothetical protein